MPTISRRELLAAGTAAALLTRRGLAQVEPPPVSVVFWIPHQVRNASGGILDVGLGERDIELIWIRRLGGGNLFNTMSSGLFEMRRIIRCR